MFSTLNISSGKRCEFIDITAKIEEVVTKSRIKNGVCRLFIPHTTAGITINENADASVKKDIVNILNALVPPNGNYDHSEGNSDAHIKSSLVGNEKTVFIEGGCLKLGTWQGIFFCEFDGPRNRQVWIRIDKTDIADEPIA
jgi:secondary thiamine-phosphate synthase enzyme